MITLGDEAYQPEPPFNGVGWKANVTRQRRDPRLVSRGKEIVLYASSWASAQRALDLIVGCHQLITGDPPVFPVHSIAHNDSEPPWMGPEERKSQVRQVWSTAGFPLACAVAAKASRRRQWVYAVAKYKLSFSLYSVHFVDLEPWRAPHLAVSPFPCDHVMFSHAIISAYSVVEDLKLTLQASSKNPGRINGEWNPVVKKDLEERLTKAGISLGEPILWTARGPKRKIEKRRALPDGTMAPWSVWIVRDSDIPVIDAIAYAEWLRSCVASHSVKDLTGVLSPYDVINVQHVARRLLLETLGFWGWQEGKERVRTKKSTAGSANLRL